MRRNDGGRRSGQALAEFAIAAIPLLLLLLAILQFGFIYNAQVGLTNAIRDAARYGSTQAATSDATAAALAVSTYARLTGSMSRYVAPYDPSKLGSATRVCVSQHDDGTTSQPAFVKVTAVYDHPLFIPLIGAIIDAFDGASNGGFQIAVTTELRIDNPTQATVSISAPACNP